MSKEATKDLENTEHKTGQPNPPTTTDWQSGEAAAAWNQTKRLAEAGDKDAAKLDNPAAAAKPGTDGADPPQQEWTMAYFLGTAKTQSDDPNQIYIPSLNRGQSAGIIDWMSGTKLKQLQDLAAETKGKPVTAIVDVERERDDIRAERLKRVAAGQEDPGSEPSHKKEDYVIDRYKISNGKVELIVTRPSNGLAADISNLVESTKGAPSSKVGLVINVDGGGNLGLQSDAGDTQPVAAINAAVADGLKSAGREKLDILDFDACIMSQTGALNAFKDTAADIVASSETEGASAFRSSGQNLAEGLKHILNNPKITGKELGEAIVGDAAAGKNDSKVAEPTGDPLSYFGTLTLANIDTSKLNEFSSAVNALGRELKTAVSNSANKAAIDNIILESKPFVRTENQALDEAFGEERRDVKDLASRLQKGILGGAIADPDGSLMTALKSVETARAKAVTAFYGNSELGYGQQGGISVFTPSTEFRNFDKVLGKNTAFAKIALEVQMTISHSVADDVGAARDSEKNVKYLLAKLPPEQQKSAEPLLDKINEWQNAKTADDRTRARQAALGEAKRLLTLPEQKEQIDLLDCRPIFEKQQTKLRRQLTPELPDWADFIKSLDWATCKDK